jgi:hypothetical protein
MMKHFCVPVKDEPAAKRDRFIFTNKGGQSTAPAIYFAKRRLLINPTRCILNLSSYNFSNLKS